MVSSMHTTGSTVKGIIAVFKLADRILHGTMLINFVVLILL